jgi:hypothetical protein
VIAAWLGLSGINVWWGELNQDEGWYLYAAKQMAAGLVPYRDFAYTQAPMLPLSIRGPSRGWGASGCWAAAASPGPGTLGLLCATWLAMRAGPRPAQRFTGGLAFILIATNVYQSYFTTVVKTYSLASLFLSAGLLALSFVGPRKGFRAATAAGFLLACAAATRISLGAALATGGLYLLVCRRSLRPWAWLDFGLGGLLGLALTVLPFAMLGRDGFRFGVIEYHSLREAGTVFAQIAFKIGCLSRLAQAYYPAAVAGLFLLILAVRYVLLRAGADEPTAELSPKYPGPGDIAPCFNAFLWITVGVLALVHLAAPFPYDDYQVPVYPIFGAALAATGARWWLREEHRRYGGSPELRSARRLAVLTGLAHLRALRVFLAAGAELGRGRPDRIWWRPARGEPRGPAPKWAKWVRELTAPRAARTC